MQITLSGLGDLETEDVRWINREIKHLGKTIKFYPTYYDYSLEGSREDIEALSMDLWGMPADQWYENWLLEKIVSV